LPNVKDEPRPGLARAVLLGARVVTAPVVGSGALLGGFESDGRASVSSAISPGRVASFPISTLQ
jgi:hypothetical protein